MKQLLKREAVAQREAQSPNNPGGERDSSTTSPPCFAEALLDRAGMEIVSWVGSNRGAFVVAALEDVPNASPRVREILGAQDAKTKILEAAKAEGKNVGVKVNEAFRVITGFGGGGRMPREGALRGVLIVKGFFGFFR